MNNNKNHKFETPTFILLVSGIGCFLLSFLAMGLAPWTSLRNVTNLSSQMNPYIDENGQPNSIGLGRKIYIQEGCWHCHSQFVRPVAGEPYRYGPASQAWESMFDIPQTFGTRRVGPDLSREAGRHSNDWHLAHLYNPRYTTPLSVMPSYPWLFTKTPEGIKPTAEGEDLVNYLQYLGKNYKEQIQEIVYPKPFKVSGFPGGGEVSQEKGQQLFQENCVGCHGFSGNGKGSALPFLKPAPANLVDRFVSPSEIYSILSRGVLGSAMPSFREMPERDLWALAQFVAKLGETTKEGVLQELGTVDTAVLERGKSLYQSSCVACHGVSGTGDGPAAVALNPRPKDFTRRLFNKTYFKTILVDGVPGSSMPPFSSLSDSDIDAISSYISQLFNKEF